MPSTIKHHWPVVAAVLVLWITVITLLALSIKQNQGHLVYALDDPYIHMAMARNLAEHGVWGVTRYEFSSSSSSLAWTLLLALIYYLSSTHQTTPLILNLIFATLSVIAAYLILGRDRLSQTYRFFLLLCVIFLTPMPSLILSGMEHSAQILVDLVFVYGTARAIARKSFACSERDSLMLLALAALVTSIRYEGLFLVIIACALFALQWRLFYSFALGLAAITPLGIFGFISTKHGSLWLPNSVILKSAVLTPDITTVPRRAILQLWATPYLLWLLVVALWNLRQPASGLQ